MAPATSARTDTLVTSVVSIMRTASIPLAVALAVLLSSCTSTPMPPCRQTDRWMVSEWLYFGTDKRGGKVEAADWSAFLNDEVTPRFPNGLSVWPASGQWKADTGQIVREGSYVLNIVHAGQPAEYAALDAIVAAYKQRHEQEAVLRVRSPACVAF